MQSPTTGPDPASEEMASAMLAEQALMREILEETVESHQSGQIKESGRTFCPSGGKRVRGPLGRFASAVDLARCPRGATGVMHTHVTQDQLLNPEHSLPDMANVILGDVDASVVVGVNTSDVMVSPSDRESAGSALSHALGVEVSSPGDVVAAVKDGHVDAPSARSRVRSTLPGLFSTHTTVFPDIEAHVMDGSVPRVASHGPMMHGCMSVVMQAHEHDETDQVQTSAGQIRTKVNETTEGVTESTNMELQTVVVGALISHVAVKAATELYRGATE